MEIRATTELPFWVKNNENKISKEGLIWFYENKMVQTLNVSNVNYVNRFTIQLTFKSKYQYLGFLDKKENIIKYFFLKEINTLANEMFLCTFELDIYSTYTLPFLEDNKNSYFMFNRNFNFEPATLNFEDEKLSDIPVIYDNYINEKTNIKTINYNGAEHYEINNKRAYWLIPKRELTINVNKYAVFSMKNGYFLIIPIFSIDKFFNIPNMVSIGEWVKEYTNLFINGTVGYSVGDWKDTGKKYEKTQNNIDEINNYKYDKVNDPNYKFELLSYDAFGNKKDITKQIQSNLNNGFPKKINWSNSIDYYGVSLKTMFWPFTLDRNFSKKITEGTDTWEDSGDRGQNGWYVLNKWPTPNDPDTQQTLYFNGYKLKEGTPQQQGYKNLKNSFAFIQQFINKPENINLFVGIFRGPNIFNTTLPFFIQDDKFDGLMYTEINANNQKDLAFLNLELDINLNNNVNVYNDERTLPSQLLRKLDFTYYNNKLDLSLITLNSDSTNNNLTIYTPLNLYYSNGFYLVGSDLTNKAIIHSQNYIHYGEALPYANDEYKKYIGQNKIITATSYNNLKQELNLKKLKANTDYVFQLLNSGVSATKNIMDKDILGGLSTGIGIAKDATNLAHKWWNIDQQLKNTENTIRAQYLTAYNTMGTEIENAGISDVIWDIEDDATQSSLVAYRNIKDETKIMFNNVIYLNGHKNPKFMTLNDFIASQGQFMRNFYYVEMDPHNLTTQRGIINNYDNEIYELVKTQLVEGIRIWNQTEMNFKGVEDE